MPHSGASKRQRDALRERMLADGRTRRDIAEEMMRRWGYRPRIAWRYAHGWSQDAAADRYNRLHDEEGRAPMSGTRIGAYERWPHGGERPRLEYLRALAEVFETDLTLLVDEDDLSHLPKPQRLTLLELIKSRSPDPGVQNEENLAYGQSGEYEDDISGREVVIMVAHEGSEHAEQAERRDIGEATLEQLRADVIRLSHEYLTGSPLPLLMEMRRVRRRMYAALDKRLWPRDTTELYLLIGTLNALMANAVDDLGYEHAADELLRAGWAYAIAIDHRPLMAFLRGSASSTAYWRDRPRQARDLAESALQYLPDGHGAARFHLLYAQAAAKLGDVSGAKRAIEAARDAAERPHRDEIHDDIGGQFACPPAKRAYLAGNTLVAERGNERDTIAELTRAADLFAAEPEAVRSYGCEAINHVNLALAQVRDGQLDAVDLSKVFELPIAKRIEALPKALTNVRAELAQPRYRGSAAAAELDERIEAFGRESIIEDLRDLPSGG
ncbi:hypothetical protein GCM10022416_37710 [Actinomadura keratinilytica]|uniref:XRE family transcriptional regulator n=3 Tax=Actinomadura keratinilytica TaxID=547461 RepID=A0ABP7Z1Y2_9ACTN